MKKALYTYLFSLCVLLLGGFNSQLSAQMNIENAFASSEGAENGRIMLELHQGAVITKTSPDDAGKNFNLHALEIELEVEEESIFSKRSLEGSNSFAALFNTYYTGYFYHFFKKCTSFSKHFSYFQSNRLHLIFEVFRL